MRIVLLCKATKLSQKIGSPLEKKPSGGLAVYSRENLHPGIRIDTNHSSDFSIWLILNKEFFGLENNITLGLVYLPPENSPYAKSSGADIIEKLEEDVRYFASSGNMLLMGDLNGRVRTDPDYIINDSTRYLPTNKQFYETDYHLPKRVSQDPTLNTRGQGILDMCVSTRLRILNGRMPGDSLGYFTCHKYNGSSTVDYVMTDEYLLRHVLFFHVHKTFE